MRCAGEIDITRDRWSEKPITLVPAIPATSTTWRPGGEAKNLNRVYRKPYKRAGVAGTPEDFARAEEKISETKE